MKASQFICDEFLTSNVKVGKNDVHSIKELKLWVRLCSAFRFTVVQYI